MRKLQMNGAKAPIAAHLTLVALLQFSSASSAAWLPQGTRHSKQAEAWRKQPPRAGTPRPFALPAARETRLENGLTVLLIEDHRSPIVTILVGIPLPTQPSTDVGRLTHSMALAEATGELITEGAGSRSSEQVAREVETFGGRLSSSANDDYAEVTLSVVAENAARMMDLMGDVLLRPTFPENEVALYKRNRIQTLVVQRQDPAFLTGEQFDRIIFGSHPYAISAPTPASVDALDREKIIQFYNSNFGPSGSVAIIAGDFDSGRMETKVREVFGRWKDPQKRSTDAQAGLELPKAGEKKVYLVDRPSSEQADFRIGGLAVKRSDPDYFPLLVANAILGAGTSSRLFLNIREQKGFAYDVYSSVSALRLAGSFFGGAETRTEVAAQAIKAMLAEFDRLRDVKVEPSELQSAKNYLNGLFSLALSTQGGVAERMAQTKMLDLGRGYLESYRSRIEAVTQEQVQQAARKYVLTDRPTIVVVGDASKLTKDLKAIGPVQVLDLEGRPAKQSAP